MQHLLLFVVVSSSSSEIHAQDTSLRGSKVQAIDNLSIGSTTNAPMHAESSDILSGNSNKPSFQKVPEQSSPELSSSWHTVQRLAVKAQMVPNASAYNGTGFEETFDNLLQLGVRSYQPRRWCQAQCYWKSKWGIGSTCDTAYRLETNQCGPGGTPNIEGTKCDWTAWCLRNGHDGQKEAKCHCELDCKGAAVLGRWQPIRMVVGTQEWTIQEGTSKTTVEQKTNSWSTSVTSTLEASLEVEGVGGASSSVSSEIRNELSSLHGSEFTKNELTEFKITLGGDHQGHFLWQWEYDVHDTCQNSVKTKTQSYALTAGKWEQPCCFPGYCTDADEYSCLRCHSAESIIPGSAAVCHDNTNSKPSPAPTPKPALPCVDVAGNCNEWAFWGECTNNPQYMNDNCAKSCGKCQR